MGQQLLRPMVVLPWAQHVGVDPRAADSAETHRAPHEIRVDPTRLPVGSRDPRPPSGQRPASPGANRLDGRLRALGLPAEPKPSIPQQDRTTVDPENEVTLAVALDILATATRSFEPDETVLQQFVQTLLFVGELGGMDQGTLQGVFAHAEQAEDRARVAHAMVLSLAATAGGAEAPVEGSTPASVGRAIRGLEKAAELAVREAVLLLQAHRPVDYLQA